MWYKISFENAICLRVKSILSWLNLQVLESAVLLAVNWSITPELVYAFFSKLLLYFCSVRQYFSTFYIKYCAQNTKKALSSLKKRNYWSCRNENLQNSELKAIIKINPSTRRYTLVLLTWCSNRKIFHTRKSTWFMPGTVKPKELVSSNTRCTHQ